MSRVYTVVGAEPATPQQEPPSLYQLWLGQWQGDLVGVLADPPSDQGVFPKPRPLVVLHHVGSIQKSLINPALAATTGLDPRDVERVMDEVAAEDFGADTVLVDGVPVQADAA